MAFKLEFRDSLSLAHFIKSCNNLNCYSDTALVKLKNNCLFILVTDCENFCCLEMRYTSEHLKVNEEFTSKIILYSLINTLKAICKRKNLFYISEKEKSVIVYEIIDTEVYPNKIAEHVILSAEHRARVYHIISSRSLKQLNYLEMTLSGFDWNKIITRLSIIVGRNGSVSKAFIEPDNENKSLTLILTSHSQLGSGSYCKITIKSKMNSSSQIGKIKNIPTKTIDCTFLTTYLKKSNNLFDNNANENVTLIFTDQGILITTHKKHDVVTLLFLPNLEQENMLLYV